MREIRMDADGWALAEPYGGRISDYRSHIDG